MTLITHNDLGSYLKYTIREIGWVVIGIFTVHTSDGIR